MHELESPDALRFVSGGVGVGSPGPQHGEVLDCGVVLLPVDWFHRYLAGLQCGFSSFRCGLSPKMTRLSIWWLLFSLSPLKPSPSWTEDKSTVFRSWLLNDAGSGRDISWHLRWMGTTSPGGSNITVPTSNNRWGTALLRPCAPAGSPSDTQGLEDVGRLWDAWNGLASLRVSWAIKKPWGLVEPLNKPGWLVGIGTYTT